MQWHRLVLIGTAVVCLLAALALTVAPARADGGIIYVDADATGANNGTSWANAYTKLQSALDWTNVHTATTYQIWVAAGVYYPDEGSNHANNVVSETFLIAWNNVQLYGGFAATETLRTQRNWAAHPTILSGDIDGNDRNIDNNRIAETWNDLVGNNAYHVLYLDGKTHQPLTGTTVLDGFIITAGNAHGSEPHYSGGGLYCAGSGSGCACSPTLTHIAFSGDVASVNGGGIYNEGNDSGNSSPTLTEVTFTGNQAMGYGGGVFNDAYSGISSPTLTEVTFTGNQAMGYGGGMYNYGVYGVSSPMLTNVIFAGNHTGNDGGGMVNDGSGGTSSPTLTNVTFSGNQADSGGGGMYSLGGVSGVSRPVLVNCILWGNAAPNDSQIYNDRAAPTITYSDVQWASGIYTGTGNRNVDPRFIAPITATAAPTLTGNYRLQSSSPVINVGNNLSVTVSTDLDGNPRIRGGVVDLGAYEAYVATLTVATAGNGTGVVTPTVGRHPYLYGAVVTLTAAAASSSTFAGWSGHADCGDGWVTLDADKSCTATFMLKPYSQTWTVMVYLNGDNDLERYMFEAFNRLELAASNPNIKVFALWDGRSLGDTKEYLVQPDSNLSAISSDYVESVNYWDWNELDMGDPDTLIDFVNRSRVREPADHYFLAIVDHGGGWSPDLALSQGRGRWAFGGSGFSWDETNDYHYFSSKDMKAIFRGVAEAGGPIDVVFYDACLMAMLEEVYQIRGGATYVVASENETWTSFPYDTYLTSIESATLPSNLAGSIVDNYYHSLQGYPRTMSAIDLAQIGPVSTTLDSLSTALINSLPTSKEVISQALRAAQKLDYDFDFRIEEKEGYVDLASFAAELANRMPGTPVATAANDLLEALGPLIIYERHQSSFAWPSGEYLDLDGTTGLSIYLPLGKLDYDLSYYLPDQLDLAADTHWDDFIFAFIGYYPQPGTLPYRGHQPNPGPLKQSEIFLPMVLKN